MRRCSYRTQWDDEEKYNVRNWCLEETWKGSNDYCIFHDPSREKDKELFKQKLMEKLDNEDYDFCGYYFPIDVDFSEWKFDKDVYFNKSTFYEKAKFDGATFQKIFFDECRFKYVSFSRTFFRYVSFYGANFRTSAFNSAIFQDVSFHRAKFRHYADFNGTIFKKEIYFNEATFKNVSFNGANFERDAFFDGANFKEYASFDGANFERDAFFNGATFHNASFNKVTFHNVSFNGTFIKRDLKFTPNQIYELNLQNTQFLFKGHITTNLKKTRFCRADLENVAFIKCDWPENNKIYEETHMKEEDLSPKDLEIIYRDLKQNMQRNGNYSRAGEFYYREMEMKRKEAKNWKDRIWLLVFYSLAGYGERPKYTVLISGVVIVIFAFVYMLFGCLRYTVINPCLYQRFIDALYFSFVTFTTLGLGDIRPVTSFGKMLICLEALLGAFLIALFVVVFVRKVAR